MRLDLSTASPREDPSEAARVHCFLESSGYYAETHLEDNPQLGVVGPADTDHPVGPFQVDLDRLLHQRVLSRIGSGDRNIGVQAGGKRDDHYVNVVVLHQIPVVGEPMLHPVGIGESPEVGFVPATRRNQLPALHMVHFAGHEAAGHPGAHQAEADLSGTHRCACSFLGEISGADIQVHSSHPSVLSLTDVANLQSSTHIVKGSVCRWSGPVQRFRSHPHTLKASEPSVEHPTALLQSPPGRSG